MDGLKQQFELIQQKQQERYRNRTSLKAIKRCSNDQSIKLDLEEVHNTDADASGVRPRRVGTSDHLDLATVTSEATAECTTATVATGDNAGRGELLRAGDTAVLQRQVVQLEREISSLKTELKQRECKLAQAQRAREEERAALLGAGGGSSSSVAASRIVELSKKNRELCAELARESNRARQLEKRVRELEKAAPAAEEAEVACTRAQVSTRALPSTSHESANSASTDGPSNAELQEQLRHARRKMREYRNQSQQLKTDLKLAHRVLASEVGEGVSATSLLSGSSSWKGRSQQIITLQRKVVELREQLAAERGGSEGKSHKTRAVLEGESTSGRIDARQKAALQKMESERKRNVEDVRKELESLRSEHARLQQQCSALKARNKTVTSDAKKMKSEMTLLMERSNRDSCLLLAEFIREKSQSSATEEGNTGDVRRWEEEGKELEQANSSLRKQLSQCQAEMKSLREANGKLQTSASAPASKMSYIELKWQSSQDQLGEQELTLPPIVHAGPPVAARESTAPRKSASAGQACTLQAHSDRHGLAQEETLKAVALTEQSRLTELVSSLQQRLDATTDRLVRIEIESRNYQGHCSKLEKQLGRRRRGMADATGAEAIAESKRRPETSPSTEDELALLRDEVGALRETLELTRHEKMEDLQLLQSMLQESKKLFVESIRRLKKA